MVTSLTPLECGARLHRFQLVLKEFFGLALGLEVNHCGWIYLFLTIPPQRLPRGAKQEPRSGKEILHLISADCSSAATTLLSEPQNQPTFQSRNFSWISEEPPAWSCWKPLAALVMDRGLVQSGVCFLWMTLQEMMINREVLIDHLLIDHTPAVPS